MTASLFWRSRSSRTALIVLLLLVSLATATMILGQAQFSDAYRRATAESVLRDYSSLVADEVIRRSAAEVGYYGYFPLIEALVHEVQQAGGLSETTRAKLLSSQDARLKRATGLAKSYFQMDMATGRLTFLEEDSRAHAPIWLRQSVRGMSAQHGENAQVLHSPAGEPPRMFLASAARGPGGRDKVAGFEV